MKKLYPILCLTIALAVQLHAQTPQGFNYQATVRNSFGELMLNSNVSFRLNLIQGSQTGTAVFTETHDTVTDDLGQVSLVIGHGNATTGSFSTVDWSLGNYYLGIEINSGNGYVAMGTTQLLSVPYALYAADTGKEAFPGFGTEAGTALEGNTPTITEDQANAITANTLKYTQAQVDAIIASLQREIDAIEPTTVTDIDGNTYKFLTYGSQTWTVEDAAMETYRDGTPIPQVTSDNEWQNLTTGAWCYIDNDPTKGKLYNWYAVMGIHDEASATDESLRKVFAPEGWHVPTENEWEILENYLIANGYNYDGIREVDRLAKAMASNSGWDSSGTEGAPGNDSTTNNGSKFNAYPVGMRYPSTFYNEGAYATFWTSTDSDGYLTRAGAYSLYYNTHYLNHGADLKNYGFSVRFVRD